MGVSYNLSIPFKIFNYEGGDVGILIIAYILWNHICYMQNYLYHYNVYNHFGAFLKTQEMKAKNSNNQIVVLTLRIIYLDLRILYQMKGTRFKYI